MARSPRRQVWPQPSQKPVSNPLSYARSFSEFRNYVGSLYTLTPGRIREARIVNISNLVNLSLSMLYMMSREIVSNMAHNKLQKAVVYWGSILIFHKLTL